MSHQRKLIRQAAVALLVSANTAAGARVKATRVEPNKKSQLPALSVYTLSEETDQGMSVQSAPRELTRNLKLEIAGWVAHSDAIPVDDAMDNLAEQIEAAMDSDRYITSALTITAVDHTTGQLTVPAHGLVTAPAPIALAESGGGVVPTDLAAGLPYWGIVIDANTIQLASSSWNAESGIALGFSDNGTLPLQLLVGTVAESILEETAMEVVADDGRSDPLVGIVTLTYAVTYRTSPAAPGSLVDFERVGTTTTVTGGVSDTVPISDEFTVGS